MASNSKEEPKTGPQPNRWYNLTLGPSFKDDSANKYCTLRYEFKPASIDKTKPGALKKTKDNRVAVEFQNNQLGKPNVTFKGSSEEYKDNDAVLFFDGQTFRLERLHRAVKQLRHDRQPGESAAGMAVDPQLSPVGKAPKLSHQFNPGRTAFPAVPVEVERIDVGVPENPGVKTANKAPDQPNVSAASPGPKNEEVDDEHQDIDIEDLFGSISPDDGNAAEDEANAGFDINMLHQNESDNEIADVDDSGDEVDKGPNAAEALRAQVMNAQGRETHTDIFGDEGNAQGRKTETTSSSSSSGSSSGSGSSSSGSSSGSSSSSGSGNGGGNNAGSDDDSVNSI